MTIRVAFIGNTGAIGSRRNQSSQSSTVRVVNIGKSLEEMYGFETSVVFPSQTPLPEIMETIARSDVAFFHRIQGSRRTWVDAGYLAAFRSAKWSKKKTIFDVDDAIHLTFPGLSSVLGMSSSAVLAGSHSLVRHYSHVSRNVHFVPSAVDTDVIGPTSHTEKGAIVLGWHGSVSGHIENLFLLANALSFLSEKYDFTLKIVGTAGDTRLQRILQKRFSKIKLDFGPNRWFAYSELPGFMSDVDIGLYPLSDTRWNRAKCSMKLLEYMAMEIPSCSSAAGENNFIVEDGENGFLASNDSEWALKVGRLIDDSGLRRDIGIRARLSVLKSYSLPVVTQSIESVLTA